MRKSRRVRIVALVLCLAVSVTLMPVATAKSKTKVKKPKLVSVMNSSKKAYVAKGKSVKLTLNGSKKVKWSIVGKKSVAKVSSKGIITGKKKGTTKIAVKTIAKPRKNANITIKVVPGVKSVKASKKTATVSVGATTRMKVKVKGPKGCYKGVVYKSSKKTIAKVSRKGVITGVAEGSCKITATAADGTKKKASCQITVTGSQFSNPANPTTVPTPVPNVQPATPVDSTSITAVTFQNSNRISVELSKPTVLTQNDFKVCRVSQIDGSRMESDVSSIYTTDQTHYIVNLRMLHMLSNYDDAEVTIESLPGEGTKTLTSAKREIVEIEDEVVCEDVGSEYHDDFYDNTYLDGYRRVAVDQLPSCMQIVPGESTCEFRIQGTLEEEINNTVTTITFENPYGHRKIQRIHWYVKREDELRVLPINEQLTSTSVAVGEDINELIYCNWYPDSSSKQMEYISGAPEGVTVSNYSAQTLLLTGKAMQAGNYPIQVRCSINDMETYFTFKLIVEEKTHLTGNLTDRTGEVFPLSSSLMLYKDNDFTKEPIYVDVFNGIFDGYVPEGTYTIEADGEYFDNVRIEGTEMNWTTGINRYRLQMVNSIEDTSGTLYACDGNNLVVENYVNTSQDSTVSIDVYVPGKRLSGVFQHYLSGRMVYTNVQFTMLKEEAGVITAQLTEVNQPNEVIAADGQLHTVDRIPVTGVKCYQFTPTETGRYVMHITNDKYVFPYLVMNSEDEGVNLGLYPSVDSCEYRTTPSGCEAGKTYNIYCIQGIDNQNQPFGISMEKIN